MSSKTVAIVNYQAGNIFSVVTACRRLGYNPVVTSSPGTLAGASKVILPGVGNASAAIDSLSDNALLCLLPRLQQPLLGVCLGMQLLFTHLEESGSAGLSVVGGSVTRFSTTKLPVPHMGWNRTSGLRGDLFRGFGSEEWFYFVHSYMAPPVASTAAVTWYGEPFTAALQYNNFFGCQFHPEKSGEAGMQVLKNFLQL